MSNQSDDVNARVLQAAMTLFGRQGLRRTSMAEVAAEAGISRATLYLRFSDKQALSKAIAGWLVERALAMAQAAWQPARGLAANLEAMILAKDLVFFRLLHASPHGAALLAAEADLARTHGQDLDERFKLLLACRARDAERAGAELGVFGGADGFGAFLAIAAAGLKHEAQDEAGYRAAVHRLSAVIAAACRGT